MRTDIIERKEEILQWIEEGQTKAFMTRQLKCKPETLNRYLKSWDIDYKGNQSGKGLRKPKGKWTLAEYLADSKCIHSDKVRKKLLEEGYKEHKCENCGLETWLGEPIALELHHIDGDRNHNELSNYQLLCPNCHAMTDSYRGRNARKS